MGSTLKQLKLGLRFRLAQNTGTVLSTTAKYPELDDDETYDEMSEMLNQAQFIVARDIYHKETYPFIRLKHELRVVDEVDTYTLPTDFLSIDNVWHVRHSYDRKLQRREIDEVRTGYDEPYGDTYYRYYNVRGMDSTWIVRGTVTTANNLAINDTNSDFSQVKMGDRLYNITDGSQGEIVAATKFAVKVSGLFGGRVNTFRVGDDYGIATAEEDRFVLRVWPKIRASGRKIVDTTSPRDITLDASDEADTYRVYFDELPDDYEQDERLTFRFIKYVSSIVDDFLPPTDDYASVLLHPEAIAGIQNVKIGSNDVPFRPLQFKQGERVALIASRESGTIITTSRVYVGVLSQDKLMMDYARSPRRMITDKDRCEFPEIFNDAIYKRAELISLGKTLPTSQTGMQYIRQQMISEYEGIINNIQNHLYIKDEPGAYTIGVDEYGNYIDYFNSGSSSDNPTNTDMWIPVPGWR